MSFCRLGFSSNSLSFSSIFNLGRMYGFLLFYWWVPDMLQLLFILFFSTHFLKGWQLLLFTLGPVTEVPQASSGTAGGVCTFYYLLHWRTFFLNSFHYFLIFQLWPVPWLPLELLLLFSLLACKLFPYSSLARLVSLGKPIPPLPMVSGSLFRVDTCARRRL